MRRSLILTALIFTCITYVFADDTNNDYMDIQVSVNPGFMNGKIKEYVYSPAQIKNKNGEFELDPDFKMSELDWDIKNIPVLNFNSDFDILNYIYAGFNASLAWPKESGNMQDYDWLNPFTTAWKNDTPNENTNYSCHTNNLDKYISFTAAFGGTIPLPAQIKLTLYGAYHYDYISLTGSNGYRKYKSEDFKEVEMEGKVISYKNEMNSVLFGLKARVNTIPHTLIEADLNFSPALTYLSAYDYHYITHALFWDKFDNIWQVQAKLSAQYKFNEHHKLGLSGSINYLPSAKGKTYTKGLNNNGIPANTQWGTSSDDTGGGGYKKFIWNISLNYSFLL